MSKKKKGVILNTFDYELFLNKSGSIENCLLIPTEDLIQIAKKYDHSYTFFIDILFIEILKQSKFQSSKAALIENQIKRLVKHGHRVELHLHPQWRDSIENEDGWTFRTFDNYRLHSFSDNDIRNFIINGTNYLESIARDIQSDYKVVAFRAGGWCIQPFDLLKKHFIDSGIWIDSTVAPGFYREGSKIQYFDFKNAPKKDYYFFEDDPCLENKAGAFLELPISTFDINKQFLYRVLRKINHYLNPSSLNTIYGDGEGMSYSELFDHNTDINKLNSTKKAMYTIQNAHSISDLILFLKRNSFYNLISHPKKMTKDSIRLLDRLDSMNYKFLSINDYAKSITR